MRKLWCLPLLMVGSIALRADPPSAFNEYPLPAGYTYPLSIATGPDGNLWFTEFAPTGGSIGRITPPLTPTPGPPAKSGSITEFPLPAGSGMPSAIAPGPGGLWFAELFGGQVGRITTAGTTTAFHLNPGSVALYGIAAGPDGNVWFPELMSNVISPTTGGIGRITPAGSVTDFFLPAGSFPIAIAPGADGKLWFTEYTATGGSIGSITTGGTIAQYPVPNSGAGMSFFGIAAGPDGNIWFADQFGNKIGRITPQGTITEFPVPTSGSGPAFITAGLDGNLWFTESSGNKIGRISPLGVITEFAIPISGSRPSGIVVGPDGNLWFTELAAENIGEAPLAAPASPDGCNGGYSGTFKGNLTISAGQACHYGLGSVTGNIQVNKGGQLSLKGTDVSGNVQGAAGNGVTIQASTIDGNLQITDMPLGAFRSEVCGSNVTGNLMVTENDTAIQIGAFPAAACAGNQVGGNLQIMNNDAPIQVGFNTVKNNLQCQKNNSITGGGNTAKHKQDQCAAF